MVLIVTTRVFRILPIFISFYDYIRKSQFQQTNLNNMKNNKQKFRRTKEEISLGLSIDEAKKHRLASQKEVVIELVDGVTKSVTNAQSEKRNRRYMRKQWCFTLNNYALEDVGLFKDFIETQCSVGAFQSELGITRKTPHLQGFFVTLERRRFTSFKLSERTHWELMRGSVEQNIKYCLKEEGFDKNAGIRVLHNCDMPLVKKTQHLLHRRVRVLTDEELFVWQRGVCDICVQEPDDRIIYYKYDDGNTGKTQLVLKLAKEYDALVIDGNRGQMAYSIMDYFKKRGYYPPIVILDIPRSQNAQWSSESGASQSYAGIEMIKNGIFNSTRYESQMVMMPVPHMFIFSNVEPNRQLFTRDRWRIEQIVLSEAERKILNERKERLRANIDGALS